MLFSTGGAALKAVAFTSIQLSGLRSLVAALALLVWARGRIVPTRFVLAGAVAYAATLTLFVAANRLTTAANAIFLQSSAPLYLVLLSPWLLGERLRVRDLPFLAALAGGMWLAFTGSPPASHTAPDPATGNLLALFAGLAWALTLIALRHAERGDVGSGLESTLFSRPGTGNQHQASTGLSIVVIGNALAALVAAPNLWPLPPVPIHDWLTVIYLGLIQIAVAYAGLTAAVRRLPAFEVSLLLLLEPVLNPVWTWLVHRENPGSAVLLGGAVIVAITAVRAARS